MASLEIAILGYAVRPETEADLAECNRLCLQVHGFGGEASEYENRNQERHQAIFRYR